MGRPTIYTDEMGKEICHRIAGGETAINIAKDADMPDRQTIYRWARTPDHPFCPIYAEARQQQIETWVDETVEIAHDSDEDPQRSRLKIDTRKWIASKIASRVYGDKTKHEHEVTAGGELLNLLSEIRTKDHEDDSKAPDETDGGKHP